jgi:hypothetical protein
MLCEKAENDAVFFKLQLEPTMDKGNIKKGLLPNCHQIVFPTSGINMIIFNAIFLVTSKVALHFFLIIKN